MKSSNIPSSIISKYSRILTGIVFTATSVLPLATSVMAQTAPKLNITTNTRTSVIRASSEAVYRIKVVNTTDFTAYKVKITDTLPTGFTYTKHITTLQKKDVRFGSAGKFLEDTVATNKPTVGSSTVVWNNITIPAKGSVEFIFTATAANPSAATTYSMPSLKVDYYSSASSTTQITANASLGGTEDDVRVKPIPPTPTLTILSSGAPIYESPICAQPGAQGVGVNLTGIVNTYFKPTIQSITAGSSSIAIASGAAKGVAQDIKPGDLVLIVQMQDATISTANTAEYGSGSINNQGSGQTSMGSSGLYEYAIANSTVLAASGNVNLTLKRPLINAYTSAAATVTSGQKRFQVIRVPQYASAKVTGTMFASPWDGNVGGILAVDAFGTFDFGTNQRMSVNEAGFRGGFGPTNMEGFPHEGYVSPTTTFYETRNRTYGDLLPQTTYGFGSGKGEGVAGTPRYLATKLTYNVDPDDITKTPVWTGGFTNNGVDGYPGGDTGRGAPGNAGGGGNFHNSGGGGGGNGGNGGQGSLGMTYSFGNATVKDTGGRPGSSSLTNTPTPMRVFMGGGGGGGEANDQPNGVPGGAGGGIVMLRAGTIVGTGTIFANGTNGDRGAYGNNPDGAGGGGAGGTVLIQSRNPTSANITIHAKGGNGGSTEGDSFYDYTGSPVTSFASQTNDGGYSVDGYVYPHVGKTPHGPGGGGAGGIVLYNVTTSTATVTPVVTGGASGLTDDVSPSTTSKNTGNVLLNILGGKTRNSNGATAGSAGQVVPFTNSDDRFADLNAQTACSPANLAMVVSTSNPIAAPGDIVSYKMKVTNPADSGGATKVRFENQLPAGFTYTSTPATGGIILTGGATRDTVANPTVGSARPSWGEFVIPSGGTVEINFKATIAGNVQNGLYHDKAYSMYPNPLRISDTAANATTTNSYGEKPNETGGDITVKRRAVPQVWKLSPTIRIVRR